MYCSMVHANSDQQDICKHKELTTGVVLCSRKEWTSIYFQFWSWKMIRKCTQQFSLRDDHWYTVSLGQIAVCTISQYLDESWPNMISNVLSTKCCWFQNILRNTHRGVFERIVWYLFVFPSTPSHFRVIKLSYISLNYTAAIYPSLLYVWRSLAIICLAKPCS